MVPPAIQPMPRQGIIRTRKGKNITLRCAGKGNPNPRISWSKQVRKLSLHKFYFVFLEKLGKNTQYFDSNFFPGRPIEHWIYQS